MTLEQLRIFVAVAERQHMTRAAEALNLTQQAVSAAVVTLESAYKTPLFHRVGRRIELTEAGRVFLEEARSVLARAAAAELALSELGGLKRGSLALQASQTIASYWLPRRLVAFRQAYPGIALRVRTGNTAQAVKAVTDGTAELGFIEGETDEPALSCEQFAEDRLVLVVAPTHPWARRDRLEVGELTQSDWVLREVGSGTRSAFETSIEQLGLAPRVLKVMLELPSNEAILDAVEAGGGATVISELVTDAALRSGRLRRVPIDLPARPFHYPPSRAVPLQGGRCIPRHCSGRQAASRTGAAQLLAFTDPACRNDKINPLDPLAGAGHMPSRQRGSIRGPTIRRASHDHSCDYVAIIAP